MKTLAEIYTGYAKVEWMPGGSDKGTKHSYISQYEDLMRDRRMAVKSLLEVGVQGGDSLKMWADYFPNAKVHGIDVVAVTPLGPRITIHYANSTHPRTMNRLFDDESLDVIIDDGSHKLRDQLLTCCGLWPKLRTGGLFVVEDIKLALATPELIQSLFSSFDRDGKFYQGPNISAGDDNLMIMVKR